MTQEIDYAAVLTDLETRKMALDAAIAAVKAILGQAAPEATALAAASGNQGQPIGKGTAAEVTPGAFHGMSITEAARKYLEMRKTKQKTRTICEAIQKGGIETSAKHFYSNVYTSLGRNKDFIRLGKYWALAEWHPTRVPPTPARPKKKRVPGASPRKPSPEKQPAATAGVSQ